MYCDLDRVVHSIRFGYLNVSGMELDFSLDVSASGYVVDVYVDIVDMDPDMELEYDHIKFDNADSRIWFIKIKRQGERYSVGVYGDLGKWLNNATLGVGEYANRTFNASGYKLGWVYVEIVDESTIFIVAEINSTVKNFTDFSDSVTVWAKYSTECEVGMRIYYKAMQFNRTIEGMRPFTYQIDYPWEPRERPYAGLIEVNDTYYAVKNFTAFYVETTVRRFPLALTYLVLVMVVAR